MKSQSSTTISLTRFPTGVDISVNENGGWRFYELLTIGEDAQYPLLFDCPVQFRRSAIRKAIGAYRAWRSNYERWRYRSKRHLHHFPPVPPRHFNFSPSFDAGIWKEDTSVTILLKIRRNGQWLWVKFSYQGYSIGSEWVKGSPSIVLKGMGCLLNLFSRTVCCRYTRNQKCYGSRLS